MHAYHRFVETVDNALLRMEIVGWGGDGADAGGFVDRRAGRPQMELDGHEAHRRYGEHRLENAHGETPAHPTSHLPLSTALPCQGEEDKSRQISPAAPATYAVNAATKRARRPPNKRPIGRRNGRMETAEATERNGRRAPADRYTDDDGGAARVDACLKDRPTVGKVATRLPIGGHHPVNGQWLTSPSHYSSPSPSNHSNDAKWLLLARRTGRASRRHQASAAATRPTAAALLPARPFRSPTNDRRAFLAVGAQLPQRPIPPIVR